MATLNDIKTDAIAPIHQLLIAPTKMGKSTYLAQAAIDGFQVLYIDADNGLSALQNALKDDAAAKSRVFYVRTGKPATFLLEFFTATNVFRWNTTRDELSSRILDKPGDNILSIRPMDLIHRQNFLLGVDSWTAVAEDALAQTATRLGVTPGETEVDNRKLYGGAKSLVHPICAAIQKVPMHIVVLAHNTQYELKEKPSGVTYREVTEKDMVIRDVLEVPVSTSNVHGYSMGKYFNYIGWLALKGLLDLEIDYTRSNKRVSGGPPNKKANLNELHWRHIVGGLSENPSAFLPEGAISDAVVAAPEKPAALAAGNHGKIPLPASTTAKAKE